MANRKAFCVDILGAGAGGLAAAYYLASSDERFHIRVWEKDSSPGGLAGTFSANGFRVEKFYHHIFKKDLGLQQLIKELGLVEQLKWRPASTGAYYFKQPFRLSSPFDLLRFKPLSFSSRIRLGLMILRARLVSDWRELDDVSVKDYVINIAGDEVYRVVWEPLLKGKFGKYADEVSAAWLWAKLVDRGSSRSKSGYEELGYVEGGLNVIFDRIVELLIEGGHEVNTGQPVDNLVMEHSRIRSLEASGKSLETDFVVSCLQIPDFVKILPEGMGDYVSALKRIEFLGNICLILTLKDSLSDFYWTNVTDTSAPFVGIVEQTNWADKHEYNGKHLVYISAYLPLEDERFRMTKEELLQFYLLHIKKMFPSFSTELIVDLFLWSAPYAQPIVVKGYRKLVPEIVTPLDNLYLSTMAQIYPADRQVSNGIDMAKKAVNIISNKIKQEAERDFSRHSHL